MKETVMKGIGLAKGVLWMKTQAISMMTSKNT
jgi:hypothetical protein